MTYNISGAQQTDSVIHIHSSLCYSKSLLLLLLLLLSHFSCVLLCVNAIDDFEVNRDDPQYMAAASLICYMLIVDWYERRDFSGGVNEKQRYSIQSLLLQLQTKPTV